MLQMTNMQMFLQEIGGGKTRAFGAADVLDGGRPSRESDANEDKSPVEK